MHTGKPFSSHSGRTDACGSDASLNTAAQSTLKTIRDNLRLKLHSQGLSDLVQPTVLHPRLKITLSRSNCLSLSTVARAERMRRPKADFITAASPGLPVLHLPSFAGRSIVRHQLLSLNLMLSILTQRPKSHKCILPTTNLDKRTLPKPIPAVYLQPGLQGFCPSDAEAAGILRSQASSPDHSLALVIPYLSHQASTGSGPQNRVSTPSSSRRRWSVCMSASS